MSTVEKARTSLLADEHVKTVSRIIADRSEPEYLAAAEIALMELALADLDRNREAITTQFEMFNHNVTKKLARAYAKTVLKKGERVISKEEVSKDEGQGRTPRKAAEGLSLTALRGRQWVKPHSKQDGTSVTGYWRSLREGESQTADTKSAIKEVQEYRRSGEAIAERDEGGLLSRLKGVLDFGGWKTESLAESITTGTKEMEGPAKSFLSQNSLAQGALSVANYFANKASKFVFFAQAVKNYGPIVAVQMANVYFRYGGYDVPIKDNKTELGDNLPPEGASREEVHNWAVNVLKGRLPTSESRDAGAKPPSEGFILDREGNVVAHGVGRGSDHFLPFSARHLRKLRKTEGGEFIRRRMFGGPTVEDLHVAMMMGADRLTVVSNGGTFTLDLTGRSHGVRLEHMQVLSRYQAVLDNLAGDRGGEGKRDFSVYNRALNRIQDEFPLHFNLDTADEGKWATDHDYVQPRTRMMDQLRELFNVFEKEQGGGSQTQTGGGVSRGHRIFTDYKGDWPRFISAETERRGGNRMAALQDAKQAYQSRGGVPKKLEQAIARERERIQDANQGRITLPTQQKATTIDPGQRNLVQQTRPAQDTKTVDWSQFPDGVDRLTELGIPLPKGRNTTAQMLVKTMENLNNDVFESIANNSYIITDVWEESTDYADVIAAIEEEARKR